jgi:hypothetical protein
MANAPRIVVDSDNALVAVLFPKTNCQRSGAPTAETGEVACVLWGLAGSPDSAASTHDQIHSLIQQTISNKTHNESTPLFSLGVVTINCHAQTLGLSSCRASTRCPRRRSDGSCSCTV